MIIFFVLEFIYDEDATGSSGRKAGSRADDP